MPGDHRVGVKKISGHFVLNKGKDPERRGRLGEQMVAAIVLNVDGNERELGLFVLRRVCWGVV